MIGWIIDEILVVEKHIFRPDVHLSRLRMFLLHLFLLQRSVHTCPRPFRFSLLQKDRRSPADRRLKCVMTDDNDTSLMPGLFIICVRVCVGAHSFKFISSVMSIRRKSWRKSALAHRRLKFVMTDKNDTSSYAKIFFSLASDSIDEKHIYHLYRSVCRSCH